MNISTVVENVECIEPERSDNGPSQLLLPVTSSTVPVREEHSDQLIMPVHKQMLKSNNTRTEYNYDRNKMIEDGLS